MRRELEIERQKLGIISAPGAAVRIADLEQGRIKEDTDRKIAIAAEDRKTAEINSEAAHFSRETTLLKMQADAAFLYGMSTLLLDHPAQLKSVFETHYKSLASVMGVETKNYGAFAGVSAAKAEEQAMQSVEAVRDQARANLERIGIADPTTPGVTRTGLFAQSDAIQKAEQDRAQATYNHVTDQIRLDKELEVQQAEAAIDRINNELKISELQRQEIQVRIDQRKHQTDTESQAILDQLKLDREASDDRIAAAELELYAAEQALKAQQQLNDYINNVLIGVIDQAAGSIKDRFLSLIHI